MKRFELRNLKIALGKSFSAFFPTLEKDLNQFSGVDPQKDLVLISVYPNGLTKSAQIIRTITGWSIKKSTNFIKQGAFPKVIQYNLKASTAALASTPISEIILKAEAEKACVIEIK